MLALVVPDLPPPPKPASFEAEGALLRAALAKAIAEPWRRLAELEAAVEGVKPYLSNTLNDGTYPMVVNSMNRAMHRPRPEAKKLEALRSQRFSHARAEQDFSSAIAGGVGRATPR